MKLTKREAEAIDAVKMAIRRLPASIHIQTDDFEPVLFFYKRIAKRGHSQQVEKLRSIQKLSL